MYQLQIDTALKWSTTNEKKKIWNKIAQRKNSILWSCLLFCFNFFFLVLSSFCFIVLSVWPLKAIHSSKVHSHKIVINTNSKCAALLPGCDSFTEKNTYFFCVRFGSFRSCFFFSSFAGVELGSNHIIIWAEAATVLKWSVSILFPEFRVHVFSLSHPRIAH